MLLTLLAGTSSALAGGNVTVPDAKTAIDDDATMNPNLTKPKSPNDGSSKGDKNGDGKTGKPGGSRTTKKGTRTTPKRVPPQPCTAKQNTITASGILWRCSPEGRLEKTYVCPIYTCVDPTPPQQPGDPTPPATTPPEPDVEWIVDTLLKQIPLPEPMMTPPFERMPEAEGVVGIPVFFGVQPEQWQPFTSTATDGTYHATITATPSRITFDTGEDNNVVTCDGPGRRVTRTDQVAFAKTLNCFHTYQVAPTKGEVFDGKISITWTMSVVTDVRPEGRVTDLVPATYITTTELDIPIIEIQAVLRG